VVHDPGPTELEEEQMRRDEPTRHGRAADALIASYVRELLADGDEVDPPHAEEPAAEAPPAALATATTTATEGIAADAAAL
jgi:hypothetical protein